MSAALQQQYWEYIPKKQRDAISDDDFAGPNRTFPIDTQAHLDAAAHLIGHADNPAAVKTKAIAIAKRKGFTLPKAWQDEEKPKEAAPSFALSPIASPLATIKACWLEDDALSLNKRQYPRETVDRLITHAQIDLSTSGALPLTCYTSHEAADHDRTLDLVGSVTRVWREGKKAMAAIAIAATDAGRNLLTLIEGGFIKSISLRGDNCEMDWKSGDIPQVRGKQIRLLGIDFTTSPGLEQIARIQGFITESREGALQDFFPISDLTLQEASMPEKLREEVIQPMASGVTQGTDGSPGSSYYPVPSVQNLAQNPVLPGGASISAHQATHDHLAGVLDAALVPIHTKESIRQAALNEAGRKIAMEAMRHLVAAHDIAAHQIGADCEGGYNAHLNPNTPGNNDNNMESKEEAMTVEEAKALLQKEGYAVEPPKSPEQILEEKLAAMQAAFDQKLQEALGDRRKPQTPPQRTSLVEGSSTEPPKRTYYRPGDYLREQMKSVPREELLDRSRPLPDWMNPERALKEFSMELLGLYDRRFGLEN